MSKNIYITKERSFDIATEWTTIFTLLDLYEIQLKFEKKGMHFVMFRVVNIETDEVIVTEDYQLYKEINKVEPKDIKNLIHRGFIAVKTYLRLKEKLSKKDKSVLAFIHAILSSQVLIGKEVFISILSNNLAIASTSFEKIQEIYLLDFNDEGVFTHLKTTDNLSIKDTLKYVIENELYINDTMLLDIIN